HGGAVDPGAGRLVRGAAERHVRSLPGGAEPAADRGRIPADAVAQDAAVAAHAEPRPGGLCAGVLPGFVLELVEHRRVHAESLSGVSCCWRAARRCACPAGSSAVAGCLYLSKTGGAWHSGTLTPPDASGSLFQRDVLHRDTHQP